MSETRTEIDNLTYDEIVNKITDALRTKTGAAGAEWTAATPLKDVGIASFDFVEYVFDMEEYFGIEIDLTPVGESHSHLTHTMIRRRRAVDWSRKFWRSAGF